ncbi:MAG: cytochrome c [Verrucomicrobia bacterium]|nr:cytochrome c [Verrucomicrobiota bacterium]
MRYFSYFLLVLLLAAATVRLVAGKRGDHSRRPPIEIFNDMVRQNKVRPQERSGFFADGLDSRLRVPGTIARSHALDVKGVKVYPFEDNPVNTGLIPGTTNFVATIPLEVNEKLMARGRERFNISCVPCHGPQADGNGITKKIGAMAVVATLHDKRIVSMPDGELFYVLSNGRNLMQGYASNIAIEDRWAIVAYVRALQLSKLGATNDVPPAAQATLK